MNVTKKPTVLLERFPYRYIQVGKLETNGMPDCRIQKVDSYTGRYRDMYLCDNEMQLLSNFRVKVFPTLLRAHN